MSWRVDSSLHDGRNKHSLNDTALTLENIQETVSKVRNVQQTQQNNLTSLKNDIEKKFQDMIKAMDEISNPSDTLKNHVNKAPRSDRLSTLRKQLTESRLSKHNNPFTKNS
jgi:hypothetical protein